MDDGVAGYLRPEVLAFACLMEAKLRRHDHDRGRKGWEDSDIMVLADRIDDERCELLRALQRDAAPDVIAGECADVANFALMVADVRTGLDQGKAIIREHEEQEQSLPEQIGEALYFEGPLRESLE